jgi:hypothetical protein
MQTAEISHQTGLPFQPGKETVECKEMPEIKTWSTYVHLIDIGTLPLHSRQHRVTENSSRSKLISKIIVRTVDFRMYEIVEQSYPGRK